MDPVAIHPTTFVTPRGATRRSGADRRPGFTLLELALSLAVTALVAAGVSSMLSALAYGTRTQGDRRRTDTKMVVLSARYRDTFHSATMVLASGPNYVVLWMGDRNFNGKPDLSELRRLTWDHTTKQVWSFSAPTSPSSTPTYNISDDFNAITSTLSNTSDFPGELWAASVSSWSVHLDQPTAQASLVVSTDLVLIEADGTSFPLHVVASIR